ncbi:tubulin binding cofactor A [Tilletiaria anomala UBC 951]|uniref:Tubulin-specific chaperone A n=1 Tax=Tilletiaria anomala (strain ATCC 24038 / CBS 436.72 / UBC 951) TaxID=1037660 RepID=A0A066VD88_TILAU|nr:tubulin binding cofactor A [Tilletiaria anomala UBC 951]KDN36560.1 tubulin binding cofactor A [Tilletiaria anomala UBC 951]
MDAVNAKRQLTIKTGVVKRLTKEEKTYVKEADEQRQRIDKYIDDGKDEWHINKQKEVLQDCLRMIPDSQQRLAAAVEDLVSLLQSLADDADISSSEAATAAREAIDAAARAKETS